MVNIKLRDSYTTLVCSDSESHSNDKEKLDILNNYLWMFQNGFMYSYFHYQTNQTIEFYNTQKNYEITNCSLY